MARLSTLTPSVGESTCESADRGPAIRRLLVLGRVVHYWHDGRFHAYAPYAREIDLWADLFPELVIASSLVSAIPPSDCVPFTRKNIKVCGIVDGGGEGLWKKIRKTLSLPIIICQLFRHLASADAIHIRCPSDLGLLGVLFAPLFSRYLVAKYAGQWPKYHREPWTTRIQRTVLRSAWWRGPVTVYGSWPAEPAHIVPFFTSGLSSAQIERAGESAVRERNGDAFRVLYVGRLSPDKNIRVLIDAIAQIGGLSGKPVECVIVGEGPERPSLEALSIALGVEGRVTFTGGLSIDGVMEHYEQADVLVLASKSEGWPKAITEAMAFGVLCIGSSQGLIPMILGDGRGLVVPPGDRKALADALQLVREGRAETLGMARRGAEWSRMYSLESLRDALRLLLEQRWKVALRGPNPVSMDSGART